jgi:phage-related minor tail protein
MEERKQFENALRLQQELERVNNLYQGIANTVQSGLVDAIEGAINGTRTLGDVARSVFGAIQRQLIDFAATSFLRAIPGIGGFFANGGRPPVGKPSIVGERGPELFVPNSAGTIIPNHELGGMGGSTNIVVNVDASGSAVEGDQEEARELGLLISAAVQSEIIQQQRPGGLLA